MASLYFTAAALDQLLDGTDKRLPGDAGSDERKQSIDEYVTRRSMISNIRAKDFHEAPILAPTDDRHIVQSIGTTRLTARGKGGTAMIRWDGKPEFVKSRNSSVSWGSSIHIQNGLVLDPQSETYLDLTEILDSSIEGIEAFVNETLSGSNTESETLDQTDT